MTVKKTRKKRRNSGVNSPLSELLLKTGSSKYYLFFLFSIVNSLNNLQPLWATTKEIDGIIYNLNKNK